jgi:uncharacterized protein (TIGR02453 family)
MRQVTAKFSGFPGEAFRFYRELEADNSKAFWAAHRETYESACREPMEAFLAELEPEFGAGRLFRPYRDIRFSADKSPYRTNCSAMVGPHGYVSLSAEGFYVGAGNHMFEPDGLKRFREAVASEATGPELARVIAALGRKGYEVDGDALRSAPRGYAADHPRIELLRYKGLHAGRNFPPDTVVGSRKVLDQTKRTLRDLQPLVQWLEEAERPAQAGVRTAARAR